MNGLINAKSLHGFQDQLVTSALPFSPFTLSKYAKKRKTRCRLRTERVCYWFNRQLKISLSSFSSLKLC